MFCFLSHTSILAARYTNCLVWGLIRLTATIERDNSIISSVNYRSDEEDTPGLIHLEKSSVRRAKSFAVAISSGRTMEQAGMSWTGGQSISMATKVLWSAQGSTKESSDFSLGSSYISDLLKSYYKEETNTNNEEHIEIEVATRSRTPPGREANRQEAAFVRQHSPFQKRRTVYGIRSTNDTVTTASSNSSIDPHDEIGSDDESFDHKNGLSMQRPESPYYNNTNSRLLPGRISPVNKFRRAPVGKPSALQSVAEEVEQDEETCTSETKSEKRSINQSGNRNTNPFVFELFGSSESSDSSAASATTLISAETSLSGGKRKSFLVGPSMSPGEAQAFLVKRKLDESLDTSQSHDNTIEGPFSSSHQKAQDELSLSSTQMTSHGTQIDASGSTILQKADETSNQATPEKDAESFLSSEGRESSSMNHMSSQTKSSVNHVANKRGPYLLALSSSSESSSSRSKEPESVESTNPSIDRHITDSFELHETSVSSVDDSGESFDSTSAMSPSKVILDGDHSLFVEDIPSDCLSKVTIVKSETSYPKSISRESRRQDTIIPPNTAIPRPSSLRHSTHEEAWESQYYLSMQNSERSTSPTSLSSKMNNKAAPLKVLPSAFRLSPASLQTLQKYKQSLNINVQSSERTLKKHASPFVTFPVTAKAPSLDSPTSTKPSPANNQADIKNESYRDVAQDDTGWDKMFQSWFECDSFFVCSVEEDDTKYAYRTPSRFVKARMGERVYRWENVKTRRCINKSWRRTSILQGKNQGLHVTAISWSMKKNNDNFEIKWEDPSLPLKCSHSDLPPWSDDRVGFCQSSWDTLETDQQIPIPEQSAPRQLATKPFHLESAYEVEVLLPSTIPCATSNSSINHINFRIVVLQQAARKIQRVFRFWTRKKHFQKSQEALRLAGQTSRRHHCQTVRNRLQRRRTRASRLILWILKLNLFQRNKAAKRITTGIRLYVAKRHGAARILYGALRSVIKLRKTAAQTILRAMKRFKKQRVESTALIRRAFAREVARKALDRRIRMKRRERFVASTTMVQRHIVKASERQEKARKTETVMKRALKMLHAEQKEKKRRRAIRYAAAKIIFRAVRFFHFKQIIDRKTRKRKYLKTKEARKIVVQRHRHWREQRFKGRSHGASRRS